MVPCPRMSVNDPPLKKNTGFLVHFVLAKVHTRWRAGGGGDTDGLDTTSNIR